VLDQLTDPSTQAKETNTQAGDTTKLKDSSKPLNWYKIVPKVTLLDYDNIRNTWGKKITFYVQQYKIYNNRDDRAPKASPPPPTKDYQYIYTGQNTEVIDFNIEFNALYFTAINVDKGKTSATAGPQQKNDDANLADKRDIQSSKHIDPPRFEPVSQTQQTSAGGSVDKSDAVNSQSVVQSIYTSAQGDMINLKMNIIGDPEFIKQDDIFVNPGVINAASNSSTPSNYVPQTQSVVMDNGEVYCTVTFKTPRDFNDATGQYLDTSGKYKISAFSGYYRVNTVESEFRGGKFVQKLDLIRYPNQTFAGGGAGSSEFAATDPRRLDNPSIVNAPSSSSKVSGTSVDAPPNAQLVNSAPPKVLDDTASRPLQLTPKSVIGSSVALPTNTNLQNIVSNGAVVPIGNN
jgi:hypothetical protein